jgi:hypothetical protein
MGLNTWLLAKVTRLRLSSVHPAAMYATQWFTAKLVMLLFMEKLFLTLLLGMSYTCKLEPEEIIRFFCVNE